MNTVLVVEDEKLIRQGIATMIKRTGVPVEEVLECANGIQALELLSQRQVDLMFTDIRMPKMNGIELVQALQELDNPPLVVAVSGYDDFSYAVDMLRHGVREYILKPVERDKLKSVMERLDKEITERRDQEKKTEYAGKRLIRYLLLDNEASDKELESISEMIRDTAGDRFYCLVAAEVDPAISLLSDMEPISDLDGMEIYLLSEERKKSFEMSLAENSKRFVSYAGISDLCEKASDLKRAFALARQRRERAFCCNIPYLSEEKEINVPKALLDSGKKLCEKEAVSTRVQLIGTSRREALFKEWNGFFTATKRGQISPMDFMNAMDEFSGEYLKVYKKAVPAELIDPFSYLKLDDYIECFMEFIDEAGKEKQLLSDAYQTDIKIQSALKYIRENYTTDLNMAVVSNEVSMNYSLFSTAFKNYTGTNFVGYVRDLRMTEAKRLLSETDLRINEISARVGYDNEKHFMKSFKSTVGVSPSEYRKNVAFGK